MKRTKSLLLAAIIAVTMGCLAYAAHNQLDGELRMHLVCNDGAQKEITVGGSSYVYWEHWNYTQGKIRDYCFTGVDLNNPIIHTLDLTTLPNYPGGLKAVQIRVTTEMQGGTGWSKIMFNNTSNWGFWGNCCPAIWHGGAGYASEVMTVPVTADGKIYVRASKSGTIGPTVITVTSTCFK